MDKRSLFSNLELPHRWNELDKLKFGYVEQSMLLAKEFNFSVLSEFRGCILAGHLEQQLLVFSRLLNIPEVQQVEGVTLPSEEIRSRLTRAIQTRLRS